MDNVDRLDENEKKKLQASKELVLELQKLFANMMISNLKYSDPTKVLDNIVDDFGHKVLFYEQKDIGEFFLNFLERMQEGLGENKVLSRKMMENQNFLNKYNL
jgi:ubiquitin carboxyl-terminal hydrolase 25/28